MERGGRIKKHIQNSLQYFVARVLELVRQPVFLGVTIVGNSAALLGACSVYLIEKNVNPTMRNPLDAIWWAVSTVTTVGYGDVYPLTIPGRLIGIVLMIGGTALFWTYAALFASTMVSQKIGEVEREVKDIERNIRSDEKELHQAIGQLESLLGRLKQRQGSERSQP